MHFFSDPLVPDPFNNPFLKKIRDNQKKLKEKPQIKEWTIGRRLTSPFKNYQLHEGTAEASEWAGDVTKDLHRKKTERPILHLSHKDSGFRFVWEEHEDQANILAAYLPETNSGELFKHMQNVSDLLFKEHGKKSAYARAAKPTLDGEMQSEDRRMEKVWYETPQGEERRTRLFKLWLNVPCVVPLDVIDSDAKEDELAWLSPVISKELDDEQRADLNRCLPLNHRWSF